MKNIAKRLIRDEKGQTLALALILLAVGGLIAASLLGYMGTGLFAGQVYERKMAELYAADAGVEDALHNIVSPNATLHATLLDLEEYESYTYPLGETDPIQINDISPIEITVTKLSLLEGLVDESEYKLGQPHEDWISMDTPYTTNQTEDYVEYHCTMSFNFTGSGNRRMQKLGAFFCPLTTAKLEGPYAINYTGAMTEGTLIDIRTETVAGGFQFVWEWDKKYPEFSGCNSTGGLDFKFKVYDPEWEYQLYFIWALIISQDVSFITNAPDSYRWLIEVTAGNTEVKSAVLVLSTKVGILTWEIN
jgi:hypothetical protein